jgi:hypothetical protein
VLWGFCANYIMRAGNQDPSKVAVAALKTGAYRFAIITGTAWGARASITASRAKTGS